MAELGLVRSATAFRIFSVCVCLVAVAASSPNVAAQQWSYVAVDVTSPDPQGFVSVVSPAMCSDGDNAVPDDGFVKGGTAIKIDAHATVTGVCQHRYGSIVAQQWLRGISAIGITYVTPVGSEYSPRFPSGSYVQDYDTRAPNGGYGSLSKTPGITGTYRIDFQTHFDFTNCQIQPTTSAVVSTVFHVVPCEPEWYLAGNPSVQVHLPRSTITLYVPPAMWSKMVGTNIPATGPAALAVSDWNTKMAGTGLTIEIDNAPCGSGGDCIEMETTNDSIDGCAEFAPSSINLTTGEIQGASAMRFPASTWAAASDARLRRTVAHELGHALGWPITLARRHKV